MGGGGVPVDLCGTFGSALAYSPAMEVRGEKREGEGRVPGSEGWEEGETSEGEKGLRQRENIERREPL